MNCCWDFVEFLFISTSPGLRRIKTALQTTMVSENYEQWFKLQTRERAKETAKIVKSDILSDRFWDELSNIDRIMMPLLLLLRDNDNNQKLAPGAGLGNVYMSFLISKFRDHTIDYKDAPIRS